MKSLNDCLIEYHEKFDDSEVAELKEKLMEMASARASFFQNLCNDDSVDAKTQEILEDYWRPLDDLSYGLDESLDVFDDLRKKVRGLNTCYACSKIKSLKPKLLRSMIGTGNMYIAYLCQPCYEADHLCVNSKIQVTIDSEIPKGLLALEVEAIREYKKSLGLEIPKVQKQ